jgi:hypothetical protein
MAGDDGMIAAFLNLKKSLDNYLKITDDIWHLIRADLSIERVRKNEVFIQAGELC